MDLNFAIAGMAFAAVGFCTRAPAKLTALATQQTQKGHR